MTDIKSVLEERGESYGDYKTTAVLSQGMGGMLMLGASYSSASEASKESMQMIVRKLVRLSNGGDKHKDNWVDIIGYAQLALDEISKTDPNIQ